MYLYNKFITREDIHPKLKNEIENKRQRVIADGKDDGFCLLMIFNDGPSKPVVFASRAKKDHFSECIFFR